MKLYNFNCLSVAVKIMLFKMFLSCLSHCLDQCFPILLDLHLTYTLSSLILLSINVNIIIYKSIIIYYFKQSMLWMNMFTWACLSLVSFDSSWGNNGETLAEKAGRMN